MVQFDQFTLEKYLDELAGKSATPGGGSAAAVIGGLGAALVSMVANLTAGRKKFAAVEADMQNILQKSALEVKEMLRLASEDSVAFDGVMAAYALPRKTDQEKQLRQEAVWAGYRTACEVPLQTASCAIRVLELAIEAAKKGNTHAVSDAAVAGYAAHAALNSALLNVRINVNYLPDDEQTQNLLKQVEELTQKGERLQKEVQAVANAILKV